MVSFCSSLEDESSIIQAEGFLESVQGSLPSTSIHRGAHDPGLAGVSTVCP